VPELASSGGGPAGGFTEDHGPPGFATDTAMLPVRLSATRDTDSDTNQAVKRNGTLAHPTVPFTGEVTTPRIGTLIERSSSESVVSSSFSWSRPGHQHTKVEQNLSAVRSVSRTLAVLHVVAPVG
jgi:hypothetical protein